jgi:hypothetical protein
VRLEGLGQLKNPVTSLGIDPVTFRLVAQCLNQLRYRVPQGNIVPRKSTYFSEEHVASIFRVEEQVNIPPKHLFTFDGLYKKFTSDGFNFARENQCIRKIMFLVTSHFYIRAANITNPKTIFEVS